MHCALGRTNSDWIQKSSERGGEQGSFRTSLEDSEVPSVTWRNWNSDCRCAIFKFLSLEPNGRWRIVALPLQCTDNINNLVSGNLVNMESLHHVYPPPVSHFKVNRQKVPKGPPIDVTYSVKSFTNRAYTGSTVRHQSRNKNLANRATKWNVSKKSFQKSLTGHEASATIPNVSNAVSSSDVVISNSKLEHIVKRSSRKKSRKKGKQNKKVSCNVGSTDPEVITEEYANRSSASETCGNNDGNGRVLSPTAPEISLSNSGIKNSGAAKTWASSNDEVNILKDPGFPMFDGIEGIHHTQASCYNDVCNTYSDMQDSVILDSISMGSNLSDSSTNARPDERHTEKKICYTDISEPADLSSLKGYFSRASSVDDVLNTYDHTEGTRHGIHSLSSTDMKSSAFNKKSKRNKVAPRSVNVPKSSSVGNMHIRAGKENVNSVWQKVQKNDGIKSTSEVKKESSVYSRFDLTLRGAPLHKRTCDYVDVNVFSKCEDRKQRDKITKKLKRKTGPALKQEYNCYSRKGSHANMVASNECLKTGMEQSDISDIMSQTKHREGLSLISTSCSKLCCLGAGFQSSKEGCVNSESVDIMQLCPTEMEHLKSVYNVSGMKNQNVRNEDRSVQEMFDPLKESNRLQAQSTVYLPHLLCDAASQEVQKQIPLAETSRQNRSSSGSLTHKWMPIGWKDSEFASSTRSDSSSLENFDEGASKRWTIKNKGNVVRNASVVPTGQEYGDVSSSSEELEVRPPKSNMVDEIITNKLDAANCNMSSEVSKGLNDFEAYSNRILEAVNDACMAQLASEAVQMVTGRPVAEFEKLLYHSSPVIHKSPSCISCRYCCSWNQVDQVGGALCRHETPNITLGCLWQWYEKYGSYGLEIRAEDSENSEILDADRLTFRAYFVPFLSGIQLFRNARCTDSVDLNNRLHSDEVLSSCGNSETSKNSSSYGSLPMFSVPQPDQKEHAITPPFVNELNTSEQSSASAQDIPVLSANTTESSDSELLLEYFEYEQPQERHSLYNKINDLVRNDGPSHSKVYGDATKLNSVNLNDLHPRSWYSVAWYPIYRIPDGNFRAAFLTYHSLGHLVRRSGACESPGMDACIVCPVVGLQCYNAQDECWFQERPSAPVRTTETSSLQPSGILEERLRTLEQTASLMARAVVSKGSSTSANRHPDYEFFLSRRRW